MILISILWGFVRVNCIGLKKRPTNLLCLLDRRRLMGDTGIVTYGDTHVRHSNRNEVVVEFVDFYKTTTGKPPEYLVFDSKFTTYENPRKSNDDNDAQLKFITI